MPNELPERLATILSNVHQTLATAESEVVGSSRELSEMLDELEQERSRIHGELEQIALDRLIHEQEVGDESEKSEYEVQLAEQHRALSNSLGRVSSLQQRVVDFAHLMTSAKQQFDADESLPGIEDAQELNQRLAMIRAKEEERRRLSREIHDGPAQVLANAIIGLEFIERALRQSPATADAPAVGEVERIKASMRDGLSEIRRFIFDLRPTMLAQRGLMGTIEHYISSYRTFLPEEISLILPDSSPPLTPEQELTAFRVVQESLQNIHRHSDATRCWIRIDSDDEHTFLEVRDNGHGFDPASVRVRTRGGSGIIGMRERAEVIGARLDLESSSGNGCRVFLVIPRASVPEGASYENAIDRHRGH